MNVIESLKQEPEKWIQTEYTLEHKSGTAIWTGNGIFFVNTHPSSPLSIVDRIKLAKAVRYWCRNKDVNTYHQFNKDSNND